MAEQDVHVGEEIFELAPARSIRKLAQNAVVQKTAVFQKEEAEDGDKYDETQVPQRGEDALPYMPDEREDLVGVAGQFPTNGVHRLDLPGFQ